ncbi:hypothetical protein KCMC57_up15890 [Kitasatospora sp. CMC57]|uniref:LppX_LprAFG lipoprotein n=1 Tax=Kitasatospora sp. CMC57 TaxID=3231513 RepID=A0AB33JT65_9ACTN
MTSSVLSAVRARPATTTAGLVGLVVSGVLLALLTDSAAVSRPVTTDEAAQLALSRLTTYESSPALVEITVPSGSARTRVHGLVDFRTHHAVGSYATDGAGTGGMIAWDQGGLGVAPDRQPADPGPAGLAHTAEGMPGPDWSPRAYTGDPFDTALHLTMALAADRPDNPQLLAQSGARKLRDEVLEGHAYGVFSGPLPRGSETAESHLTYWVDGDGNLGRVELRTAAGGQPITVELKGRRLDTQVPQAPWGR